MLGGSAYSTQRGTLHPDIEKLLTLLANIPTNDLDVQTCGAIHHARKVAAGVRDGSAHTAVARFALARVIILLEQHVAIGLP